MSACCVSACKNRHSAASGLKFYRIPSGHRPFQANRRRLWLRAIQQANGGDEVRGNVRVCGAHFISGEASMDHDSPDFVPSVFTRRELSSTKKKERKKSFIQRFYSRRRRRRRKVDVGKEETQSPTEAEERSPVVVATEREAQATSSPSAPQGEEALRKEAETQSTSSPNKTPRSSALFGLRPDRMNPVVLLTPLLVSAGGYRCELSGHTVTASPPPGEHRPLEEEEEEEETPSRSCEVCGVQFSSAGVFSQHRCATADEPSFACNMCDRTFTTTHHLKRHKLLHVRDGRKCGKCGVLFCRRHNHVAFQPATAQHAQDSSSADDEEPRGEDEGRTSEHGTSENPERSRPDVVDENARETTPVLTPPATTTTTTLHYIHYIHTTTTTDAAAAAPECPKPGPLSKKRPVRHLTTVRLLPKPSPMSRPLPTEPRITIHPGAPPPLPPLDPPVRPSVLPPGTELPSSLKIFSPHYLTSPLFHVRRNFEYILSKLPRVVKEEPVEEPLSAAGERRVADEVMNEKVAYDLEIVV